MPLHGIAERAALLLLHHPRKSDGKEATASRGSGALPAFVDTILELRRHDAENRESTKRVLTGFGRWDETPAELVIELDATAHTYYALGDRQTAALDDIRETIRAMLPRERPGHGYEDLRDAWPGDKPPTKSLLLEALRTGTDQGLWFRDGTGKKGSPFTHWIQPP